MQDIDLGSLRPEELIALVRQLCQQLAAREQEIEKLKRQGAEKPAPSAVDEPTQGTLPGTPEGSSSGSQADLLAQLEKIYHQGR